MQGSKFAERRRKARSGSFDAQSRLAGTLLAIGAPAQAQEAAPQKDRHVVLIIWDGMRPDYITEETSPNLFKLASGGTFFANHHSVYITSTEVNGTAIATGCYPNRNGIMANLEYRPDLHLIHPINTENLGFMRISDALTGGKYIAMPTIAETVQAAGFPTVVAGAKPVASIQDRNLTRTSGAAKQSVLLYAGATQPQSALQGIESVLGPFPPFPEIVLVPNEAQNQWTTKALTEVLWKTGVPKFSVLWLGDPDYTQHQLGPGSYAALAAVHSSDTNLGTVLKALEAKGVRDQTDVFIVSDHGFSTVDRILDLLTPSEDRLGSRLHVTLLRTPEPGEVLVVALGGSTLLYVIDHDREVTQRLVDFLQQSNFSGPIFTRETLPGTFALKDARIDTPNAPDIVFSYRWSSKKSRFGAPGLLTSEAARGKVPASAHTPR